MVEDVVVVVDESVNGRRSKANVCAQEIVANDSERTSSRWGNEENGMIFLEEAKGRELLLQTHERENVAGRRESEAINKGNPQKYLSSELDRDGP
jgi:hypothetical protein